MAWAKVYENPDAVDAARHVIVKDGFCWPGFFLTFGWALYRRLWLHAVIIAALLSGSRLVSIYFERRLDTNPDDSIAAIVVILAGLILIITCVVIGMFGNRWVESSLQRRGYTYLETVETNATPTSSQ